PADLIVRPQFYRSFSSFDGFLESPQLHKRHPERVPTIEKIRIKLHAPVVLFDRDVQGADGNITARVVKYFVGRCHLLFSLNDHNDHNEIPKGTFKSTTNFSPLWTCVSPNLSWIPSLLLADGHATIQ